MLESQKIKDLAIDDRPREKLQDKGKKSLSDSELLAIIIGSGNKNESAVVLSKRILADQGHSLELLTRLEIPVLTAYKGIGTAKAISIVAALELGRRMLIGKKEEAYKITDIDSAKKYCQNIFENMNYESFHVILLRNNNTVIKHETIGIGGISSVNVDIQRLFKMILMHNASKIILTHNHPSGNITPSEVDKKLTQKIKKAAELFNITLLDHIILADNSYLSFSEKDLI